MRSDIALHYLKHLGKGIAEEVGTEGGFTLALFQGWGVGSEVLLEEVQLNFSFQNKFFILLPCGLLVDNNTIFKNVHF